MNDQEFIELINLYVDREIAFEDAARLEAEVLSNPSRREIYQQYCRMQKACLSLAAQPDQFQAAAPELGRLAWFGPSWGSYATALTAVAACLGAFFVIHSRQVPDEAIASAAPLAVAAPVPATDAMKPVFVARSFRGLTLRSDSLVPAVGPSPQLDWIADVRVAPARPVQQELFFPVRPELSIDDRGFQDTTSDRAQVEMTAFKFQR